MSDFKKQVTSLTHSDNATGGLYLMLMGMFVGNLAPSVGDAVFFRVEKSLRDKWKRGELSASRYWAYNTAAYYGIPFTYWFAIFLLIINIEGDYQKKLKISMFLIGGGIAAGVILKAIQTDKKQLALEDEEKLLLLKNYPEIVNVLNKPEYENISGQFTFKNYSAIRAKQQILDKQA